MFEFYSNLSILGKLIFYFSLLIVLCSIFYQCFICKYVPLRLSWTKTYSGQAEPVVYQEPPSVNILPPVEAFQDRLRQRRPASRRSRSERNRTPRRVRFQDQISPRKENDRKLILFYADWCGHCQRFKPQWNKLVQSLKGIIKTVSINGEKKENGALLKKYKVDKYPTIILEDGQKQIEYDGDMTIEGLKQFVYTRQNNGSYSQDILV